MNGPISAMYTLKPLFSVANDFSFSSNMYGMKKLNSFPPSSGIFEDQFNEIEQRQIIIFSYISDIKKHLATLKTIITKRNKSLENHNEILSFNETGVTNEVVIHGDIEHPPYSLLGLHLIIKDKVSLQVNTHCHSSVKTLPPYLEDFNHLSSSNLEQNVLKIRLIWKSSGGTEVVLNQVCLPGEVSLLRFVHKWVNAGQLSPSEEVALSSKLDECQTTGPESLVKSLDGSGGNNRWLADNKLSVVDLAVWSALKSPQKQLLMLNDDKVTNWFNFCDLYIKNHS